MILNIPYFFFGNNLPIAFAPFQIKKAIESVARLDFDVVFLQHEEDWLHARVVYFVNAIDS